jgi:hypothetical protein
VEQQARQKKVGQHVWKMEKHKRFGQKVGQA